EYHHHDAYIKTNRELTRQRKDGNLVDAYTGRPFAANERTDLDHVVPAKEVHYNRGRVLSGLDGPSLANSPENLKMTNMNTNRSKKASTMEEFIERKGAEYTDAQKENMLRIDKMSRKSMDAKILLRL
ncbi:MAG: hypothetical protein J6I62_10270, partial [Selenomonadaceae bacterium]|nr:hypothetical protein [Selenomonadaceae bacterium]